ncbi:small-subunit processome [Rhodofomes roseus]|uniref:Small-subunit processome n=1 Tax=Rhodofomes roseus TaxID=34475 RepID=A0ABQ8KEC6_9APHY|nr:small-subunit processome [Rhodofomes roseus]KAH9835906.1 small-subunit processome [Rhodofomes roseus]
MSSLRNSTHRRNHKERSQLTHRAKFGILEKHKDYVLRARDYHSKKDRITRLRQRAAERNKDEFYFAMNRQQTRGGVHMQSRGNEALPVDIVKVLKSQDENYLRTMRTAGLKKIEKLKNQLTALADLLKRNPTAEEEGDAEDLNEEELGALREAGILAAPSGKRRKSTGGTRKNHILFAESAEEAREYASAPHKQQQKEDDVHMDDASEDVDLGWKAPQEDVASKKKRRKSVAKDAKADEVAEEERRQAAAEHRTRLLKELSARLFRDRQLRYAERELEMQKLIMGKGTARKLRGVEQVEDDDDDDDADDDDMSERRPKKVDEKTWKPRVYKWRVERKK